MPAPDTLPDVPVGSLVASHKMAKAILQIAEGLAMFASSLEETSKLGPLPDELLKLAQDIRKPVLRTLHSFQVAVFPDDPIAKVQTRSHVLW